MTRESGQVNTGEVVLCEDSKDQTSCSNHDIHAVALSYIPRPNRHRTQRHSRTAHFSIWLDIENLAHTIQVCNFFLYLTRAPASPAPIIDFPRRRTTGVASIWRASPRLLILEAGRRGRCNRRPPLHHTTKGRRFRLCAAARVLCGGVTKSTGTKEPCNVREAVTQRTGERRQGEQGWASG